MVSKYKLKIVLWCYLSKRGQIDLLDLSDPVDDPATTISRKQIKALFDALDMMEKLMEEKKNMKYSWIRCAQ